MSSTLMKTAEEAVILTSIVAGVGWVGKKVLKINFSPDPGASIENFAKMTATVAGSIIIKDYLQKEKYIPSKL